MSHRISVGIEHAGFDATGFLWYNATEYLSSARLTAYLLKKYAIPLDHAHVVSHGTIPSPFLAVAPNHVDPGPYWLWDYYLKLIHSQGVSFPDDKSHSHIITLRPGTDLRPFGRNGTETLANFNFFYLYNGPSTASGLIPQQGDGSDVTDVTNNVEPAISYYHLTKVKDSAGTAMHSMKSGMAKRIMHTILHQACPPMANSPGLQFHGEQQLKAREPS